VNQLDKTQMRQDQSLDEVARLLANGRFAAARAALNRMSTR
jgi:hypothetical protein